MTEAQPPGGGISRRQFGLLGVAAGAAGMTGAAACGAAPSETPSTSVAGADVGFVLSHEQFRTPDLVSFAERAEQAGFGHVWASDHLQPWQDNEGHSMFPWLTLALVSQRTRRVPFGTGVTCPTYRYHPADVAQAFASLALLAPGRVFLGVGTGEAVNEQAGTAHYGRYTERHDRLAEAIDLICQLWTGQRISFRGRYFQTDQLRLYDLPDRPPPIYVAAGGPKSARLAGQYGDGWIGQAAAVTDPGLRAAFADGARASGKNPDAMPRWAETFAVVGDQSQIDRAAERWRFTAAGTDQPNPVAIQQAAERGAPLPSVSAHWATGTDSALHVGAVQRILDAGATPFMHFPQDDPTAAIDFYRTNVLPRLRH
ncbi:F420-dependent hydroxymycolic acid dehydrogenase [Gandjariella thermophila]|uniref:F420-dependent hydroxymycolic acid dehydrogenase n=1 Tax=Gandjariella thermophila TaxID=1931992 RepID=A0A4D4JA57_9PSEU|nr:F420-dependent hydroxymycolic acid dehydrogenase [Gandjariella thermophila]GDY31558.1 F420-dependent hydroxymycolic acid dehydrogenase [Gandjariella thermophila]